MKEWNLKSGLNESLLADVELLASQAGDKLGTPSGSTKLNYWMYRLYEDLRARRSKLLFAPKSTDLLAPSSEEERRNGIVKCAMIVSVCEASAIFCARLEQEEVEGFVEKRHRDERTAQSLEMGGTHRRTEPIELGKGGVKFVRQGDYILAEPCEKTETRSPGVDPNSTASAVKISYAVLSTELPKVYALVKAKNGSITGKELRKQFRSSPLSRVADRADWDSWAGDFSPGNRDRGRPKGAALTFLERKMSLNRNTLKTYLSKANKPPKR